MRTHPRSIACAVLCTALALTACSRHGAAPGAGAGPASGGSTQAASQAARGIVIGPNKSFAKITYRPEVKTVERAGFLASLVAASPDGRVLIFHNAPADIHALKGGDVLLIKSELVRKVLGAEDHGAETYVITDRAMIGDVVKDGEINVDAPLTFSRAPAAFLQPARPTAPDLLALLMPSAYAQISPTQAIAQKAEQQATQDAAKSALQAVVSGWTVSQWQSSTDGDQLNYTLVLAKNFSGFVGEVAASGVINNFRFWSNINVSNGLIASIRTGLENIQGKLHFDWQVAKGTSGGWNTADPVKLPGTVSIPLAPLLEGLPLTLEVSSALLIHPALTGGNQVQTGGFTINVQGAALASIDSGGAVPGDSSINQTFQITNDTGISPVAPDAMVISYCAPRIELQFSPFGSFSLGQALQKAAPTFESYAAQAAQLISKYAPGLQQAWQQAGSLGPNSVSAVLKSSADVYAQLVSTEGVVHAATIGLAPCSMKWIEFQVQVGTAANIAGTTPNAKASTVLYTKTYRQADPPSNFCMQVGGAP
jgi:hypothetical protein